MTGYFLKPGKYGSAAGQSVVVSEDDVKDEKLFEIGDDYAKYFIQASCFVAGAPKPPDAGEFKKPAEKKKKPVTESDK